MRLPRAIPFLGLLLGSFITACNSPRGDAATNAVAPAAESTPPTQAAIEPDADVTTHYACDAGTSVAMLQNGRARVSLPDGSSVDLARVAGSQPAVFAGSSLYFTIGDRDAHLSQQDDTNELVCERAEPVAGSR
jgi:hypothetical protein